MAKITIDEDACVGCGLCVNVCEECFEMAENGIVKVKSNECTGGDLHEVASQCPVNAIGIEE
ncbi:MAG: ferredoxin [Candidatus Omnitrophica bacterium]|nr:ferredoxin [Candidatus Omnitrophota bacterium]MBU0878368.1 ferredoxin [Candidatus Omnitrophota bacterium]MBU0896582.1 ferredoxin [Candidatus Omnitrophota bacterium]MBU1810662.1 ferredoxin [Candidatus Omnitrophota bacterium]MBU2436837.1 ferredoxin [Candidatus Omnitrophota bacterium]